MTLLLRLVQHLHEQFFPGDAQHRVIDGHADQHLHDRRDDIHQAVVVRVADHRRGREAVLDQDAGIVNRRHHQQRADDVDQIAAVLEVDVDLPADGNVLDHRDRTFGDDAGDDGAVGAVLRDHHPVAAEIDAGAGDDAGGIAVVHAHRNHVLDAGDVGHGDEDDDRTADLDQIRHDRRRRQIPADERRRNGHHAEAHRQRQHHRNPHGRVDQRLGLFRAVAGIVELIGHPRHDHRADGGDEVQEHLHEAHGILVVGDMLLAVQIAEHGLVQHRIDADGDGRHEQLEGRLEMMPVGVFQTDFLECDVLAQLHEHDALAEQLRAGVDHDVDPQVIRRLAQQHDQGYAQNLDDDVADGSLLEVLDPEEEPADVQHGGDHRQAGQLVDLQIFVDREVDEDVIRDHGHDHVQKLHVEDFEESPVQIRLVVADLGNLTVAVGVDAQDAEQDEPVHDAAGEVRNAQIRRRQMLHRIRKKHQRQNNFHQLVQDVVDVVADQFSIHIVTCDIISCTSALMNHARTRSCFFITAIAQPGGDAPVHFRGFQAV